MFRCLQPNKKQTFLINPDCYSNCTKIPVSSPFLLRVLYYEICANFRRFSMDLAGLKSNLIEKTKQDVTFSKSAFVAAIKSQSHIKYDLFDSKVPTFKFLQFLQNTQLSYVFNPCLKPCDAILALSFKFVTLTVKRLIKNFINNFYSSYRCFNPSIHLSYSYISCTKH